MKAVERLKRDARENELQVIEREGAGGLHITVIGNRVVHWWPQSRRQTAYVEGSGRGLHHATAQIVINAAKANS